MLSYYQRPQHPSMKMETSESRWEELRRAPSREDNKGYGWDIGSCLRAAFLLVEDFIYWGFKNFFRDPFESWNAAGPLPVSTFSLSLQVRFRGSTRYTGSMTCEAKDWEERASEREGDVSIVPFIRTINCKWRFVLSGNRAVCTSPHPAWWKIAAIHASFSHIRKTRIKNWMKVAHFCAKSTFRAFRCLKPKR